MHQHLRIATYTRHILTNIYNVTPASAVIMFLPSLGFVFIPELSFTGMCSVSFHVSIHFLVKNHWFCHLILIPCITLPREHHCTHHSLHRALHLSLLYTISSSNCATISKPMDAPPLQFNILIVNFYFQLTTCLWAHLIDLSLLSCIYLDPTSNLSKVSFVLRECGFNARI